MKTQLKYELQDICKKIVDCEHKTAPVQKEGFPSIRTPNIGKGQLLLEGVNRVSEETWVEWTKREIPKENDLIFAREAPLGNVAIIPKNIKLCLGQRTVLLRADSEKVLPRFLCYLMLSPSMQHTMHSRGGGSTVPHLNVKEIRKLPILLPPLPTQQKITHILSAYDDLIENNLKRIKRLEEMAQITYEQWFVRMKFPEHETTTIDAETGLPEGWKAWNLNELISIKHGYAYKGKFFKAEKTTRILLTPGNFKIGGGLKLDKVKYYDEQAENPKDYILNKHDLLVTMTDLSKMADTLGYPLLVPSSNTKTYLHNQRLGKILPVDESYYPKYFFYMLFKDERYRGFVVGSASGATVKHTSPSKILAYKPKLPSIDSNLIQKYDEYARPIFNVIDNLFQQNQHLKEARDILLPRLMTGLIDVDTLNNDK